jgi:hypothetical protein
MSSSLRLAREFCGLGILIVKKAIAHRFWAVVFGYPANCDSVWIGTLVVGYFLLANKKALARLSYTQTSNLFRPSTRYCEERSSCH